MKKISCLTKNDWENAFEIEQKAHEFCWTKRIFMQNQSESHLNLKCVYQNQMVGFLISQLVFDEANLFNLAIHPDFQQNGFASALFKRFLIEIKQKKIAAIWLEVRESNQKAINFYHKFQFNEVDFRKNYYPTKNGRENAIIMARYL